MTQARSISHFLIERELGRGGMGVVYQGQDTRLNRPVAIKSLPPQFSSDARWRTNFEAEARTLAAVNHPNIAAIYAIESDDTGYYLILELAEGKTLDERLFTQPPDLPEALDICRQVALGIAAAHDRGIIHRDLKPSNIKLRPDGVVKVLDFGIAQSAQSGGAADPNLPTVIAARVNPASTIPGFMTGTPGYMSPEQARGKAISAATDLWSLGCVLFECLAHRTAIPGETLADAIAMTLLGQPDFDALPARTPARVHKLLRTCLCKEAGQRMVTMAQAAAILDEAARDLSGVPIAVRVQESGGDYEAETGNLPRPDGAPLGREGLCKEVVAALDGSRLVTITGPTGAGSTCVALAAANERRASFRAGAWWAPIPSGGDPSLPALLTACLLGASGSGAGLVRALRDRIAERAMLLVLDACSNAPGACAALCSELLRVCPKLRVLATARAPLGAPGEALVKVPPLPSEGPQAIDAAKLLIARSRGADPGFALDARVIARALSEWFGGNPLAIGLGAPLAAGMSPDVFDTQLRLRAGTTDSPAKLPPDRLCRVLAAWAVGSLASSGLALLLRAGAFAGPWSVRSLAGVGGAADSLPAGDDPTEDPPTPNELRLSDQISQLAGRGLVQRLPGDESPARAAFVLPDVVKHAAQARLAETPGAEAVVLSAYRGYVAAVADHASARLSGSDGHRFASRLEAILADVALVADSAVPEGARARAALARLREVRGLG